MTIGDRPLDRGQTAETRGDGPDSSASTDHFMTFYVGLLVTMVAIAIGIVGLVIAKAFMVSPLYTIGFVLSPVGIYLVGWITLQVFDGVFEEGDWEPGP